MRTPDPRTLRRTSLLALAAAGLAGGAAAQGGGGGLLFSIDWHGPTIALPDGVTAVPVTEGDLLTPAAGSLGFGPLATPAIALPHGAGGLGLLPGCVGHFPGTPCHVEVDALSLGFDQQFQPNFEVRPGSFLFSTDEYATGGPIGPAPPFLPSEAPVGDSATDMWTLAAPLPPMPLPPFAGGPNHTGVIDGDGLPSGSGFVYPGTGLIEPNLPWAGLPGSIADTGDNLDAATFGNSATPALGAVYFSLDAGWMDPLNGVMHSGSAAAHGFSAADVLVRTAVGPAVFAPAPMLGLDQIAGMQDDLDALLLCENGNGVFDPSSQPYDWMSGATDMLLFSVRRGSPVIGMPDSIFGIPISEGDILTTPLPTALGGVSPFPGIMLAAENMGLATLRSGTVMGNVDDDLNALAMPLGPIRDCNGNGMEDAVDIAMGVEADANSNGIPDSCEPPVLIATPYCFCATAAPCGNLDPTAGCTNSTGLGGLLTASGTSSIGLDDLVLTGTQLPPSQFGMLFMGPVPIAPTVMGDGLRCVGGTLRRFLPPVFTGAGSVSVGPGLVAYSIANFPAASWISAGSTWNFQLWYRDPAGPCGSTYNVTNAVGVTFF